MLRDFTVACSYLEIYNESITDLLTAETGLPIREDPRTGPFVEGLSVEAVKDGEPSRKSRISPHAASAVPLKP